MSKDNHIVVSYCVNGTKTIILSPGVTIKYDRSSSSIVKNSSREQWTFNCEMDRLVNNDGILAIVERFGELEAWDKNNTLIPNEDIHYCLQNGEYFEDYSSEKVPDFLKMVNDTKNNQVSECVKLLKNLDGSKFLGISRQLENLSFFERDNIGLNLTILNELMNLNDLSDSNILQHFKNLNHPQTLQTLKTLQTLQTSLQTADSSSFEPISTVGQVDLTGDVEQIDNQGE